MNLPSFDPRGVELPEGTFARLRTHTRHGGKPARRPVAPLLQMSFARVHLSDLLGSFWLASPVPLLPRPALEGFARTASAAPAGPASWSRCEGATTGSKEQTTRSENGRGTPRATTDVAIVTRVRRAEVSTDECTNRRRRQLRVARHDLTLGGQDHRHEIDERGPFLLAGRAASPAKSGEGRLERAPERRTEDAKRTWVANVVPWGGAASTAKRWRR